MTVSWFTHGNGTSTGAAVTAEVQAEGAAFKAPEWASRLLAVRVGAHMGGAVTADEQVLHSFRLGTNDFNINPFYGLLPPVGCADATPSSTNAVNMLTYYVNAPLNPGSNINTYFTPLEANTAAAYCHVDYCFGSEGEVLPFDHWGGRQRFRVIGTYTSAKSYADGRAPGTAYTFNGGETITETGGIVGLTTATEAVSGRAYIEFGSAEVEAWPSQITGNMYGAKLGATGAHIAGEVTREICKITCEPVVTVQDYLVQGEAQTGTNMGFVSMVEFIRPAPGGATAGSP